MQALGNKRTKKKLRTQALGNERTNRVTKEKIYLQMLDEERTARLQVSLNPKPRTLKCMWIRVEDLGFGGYGADGGI